MHPAILTSHQTQTMGDKRRLKSLDPPTNRRPWTRPISNARSSGWPNTTSQDLLLTSTPEKTKDELVPLIWELRVSQRVCGKLSSSHVEMPGACAGPNDGRTRLVRPHFVPPLRAQSTSRHLLRPYHAFFPIPFHTVNICANFASSSRDSLQSSNLMPNIRVLYQITLSPAKKRVPYLPVSFDFSVLFLHTISLIHRHLALYHSQVAIFEFESFESLPTSKIRHGICPSILSHCSRMYVYGAWETDLVGVR